MKLFFRLVCYIVVIACIKNTSASSLDYSSPIVRTKNGPVRGQLIRLPKQDVYQFTGIPFAEPPVGERRFKKPYPKTSWMKVLDATKRPKACIQQVTDIDQSEDCLHLNIWVPKATLDALTNGKKQFVPVYVFVHGGGFLVGRSMNRFFNGTVMSSFNNIIFVSIQYRLGTLGFAFFDTLSDASPNVGLWDQLEALKWVSENIATFGGNSSEVTLGGHSAGAASVTFHLTSPYSRKYFQRAIAQSGTALCPWALNSPEKAMSLTKNIAKQSKCLHASVADMLKCLRSLDAKIFPRLDLTLANMKFGYPMAFGSVPVIDGDFVPRHPRELLNSGDFYKIPMLIGTDKNEGSLFTNGEITSLLSSVSDASDKLNYTHYEKFLKTGFKEIGDSIFNAIKRQYLPNHNQGLEVIKNVLDAAGDYSFICPTYNWINATLSYVDTPIFVYRFVRRPSNSKAAVLMGVEHGSENAFVFGEPFAPHAQAYGYNNVDRHISKTVLKYLGNFIKYGDANARNVSSRLPKWPAYRGTRCQHQTVEIGTLIQINCGLKVPDCAFWEKLLLPRRRQFFEEQLSLTTQDLPGTDKPPTVVIDPRITRICNHADTYLILLCCIVFTGVAYFAFVGYFNYLHKIN